MDKKQPGARRMRRFTQAGSLVRERIRRAGESRGFAEARVLTQWEEICGTELAALARPLKVGYGRRSLGATLTIACDGARAPEVQMRAEEIRARVNACYGYNAIARVRLVQDDATGFAEAQAKLTPPPAPPPDPALRHRAAAAAAGIGNQELRLALERLGHNIISKGQSPSDRGES